MASGAVRVTPNFRVTQTLMPLKILCGPYRAPGSNTAAWVVQSFLHEVAVAAGKKHDEFLVELFSRVCTTVIAESDGDIAAHPGGRRSWWWRLWRASAWPPSGSPPGPMSIRA